LFLWAWINAISQYCRQHAAEIAHSVLTADSLPFRTEKNNWISSPLKASTALYQSHPTFPFSRMGAFVKTARNSELDGSSQHNSLHKRKMQKLSLIGI
jgi:hypothetical protein